MVVVLAGLSDSLGVAASRIVVNEAVAASLAAHSRGEGRSRMRAAGSRNLKSAYRKVRGDGIIRGSMHKFWREPQRRGS